MGRYHNPTHREGGPYNPTFFLNLKKIVTYRRGIGHCLKMYNFVINDLKCEHSCNYTWVKKENFAGHPRHPPQAPSTARSTS